MNDFSFSTDSFSSSESVTLIESIDKVQAKKTALIFLCRINADWRQVEHFLLRNPEALLFEGADVEESAESVIEEQIQCCRCFVSVCNANRRRLLILLKRGFEYYRGIQLRQSFGDDLFYRTARGVLRWEYFAEQLIALERDLRELAEKEVKTMKRMETARQTVKECRFQLESASRQENLVRTPFARLKCQRAVDVYEKRSHLETTLHAATMTILSLDTDYELFVQERVAAKRLQIALLKATFTGCERHVCDATRKGID